MGMKLKCVCGLVVCSMCAQAVASPVKRCDVELQRYCVPMEGKLDHWKHQEDFHRSSSSSSGFIMASNFAMTATGGLITSTQAERDSHLLMFEPGVPPR